MLTQAQGNVVSYTYWPRKRVHTPPSLMTIPGELRNRICDFVFELAHPPDEDPSLLNNDHLSDHFNLLLCSRQLRHELFEKIFEVDRFFQNFEALDAWISRGNAVNSEMLPQMRHIGIQMGRTKRRPDCDDIYNDLRIQKAFSSLSGLRTLHISSPYALRSFVMSVEEVSRIMASTCKVCPSLERLAFLVPSANLNFLYGLSNLKFLAITTPTFFDAAHFISIMHSLPSLKVLRVRDKSCSSAFTPFILSQMPPLRDIQLKDDIKTGRLVVPEMMTALVQRHGNSVTSLHLEASRLGDEGTIDAILDTLPKLQHLSVLKLWFDPDRREEKALEALLVTLSFLRKLKYLHLCFRPPSSSDPEQIWQKIMRALKAGGTGMRNGEFWMNEEGYVLDDGGSGWVRDGRALRQDDFYASIWSSNRGRGWSGKARYDGCMQVRVWK